MSAVKRTLVGAPIVDGRVVGLQEQLNVLAARVAELEARLGGKA